MMHGPESKTFTKGFTYLHSILFEVARFCIDIIGLLPLRLRVVIGRGFGFLYYFVSVREKQTALLQLRKFCGLKNPHPIVRKIFMNFGQSVLESFNLQPIIAADNLFEFDDIDAFHSIQDEYLRGNKGIVALSAHLGNWDLLSAYMRTLGFDLTVVGKEAKHPVLQKLLEYIRVKNNVKVLWRSDRRQIREIQNILESKQVIAALIDQDTRVGGISIPFFGTPAHTPSALVKLGKKNNSMIVFCFLSRTDKGYKVYLRKANSEEDEQSILMHFSQSLQQVIEADPSQWVWFHKRWRTLPTGYRRSSKEYLEDLSSTL